MAFPHDGKKFQKGQSGNPKGGPKKLPELDKLLSEVLGEEKEGVTAMETIIKALRMKAAKGDIRAAEILLDRCYGKSKQHIKMDADLNLNPFKWEEIEGNKEDNAAL